MGAVWARPHKPFLTGITGRVMSDEPIHPRKADRTEVPRSIQTTATRDRAIAAAAARIHGLSAGSTTPQECLGVARSHSCTGGSARAEHSHRR